MRLAVVAVSVVFCLFVCPTCLLRDPVEAIARFCTRKKKECQSHVIRVQLGTNRTESTASRQRLPSLFSNLPLLVCTVGCWQIAVVCGTRSRGPGYGTVEEEKKVELQMVQFSLWLWQCAGSWGRACGKRKNRHWMETLCHVKASWRALSEACLTGSWEWHFRVIYY